MRQIKSNLADLMARFKPAGVLPLEFVINLIRRSILESEVAT